MEGVWGGKGGGKHDHTQDDESVSDRAGTLSALDFVVGQER